MCGKRPTGGNLWLRDGMELSDGEDNDERSKKPCNLNTQVRNEGKRLKKVG